MHSVDITIITGAKDSGKTSWCRRNLTDVDGVLSLKVIASDICVGYDALRISSGETLPFLRKAAQRSIPPDENEWIGSYFILPHTLADAERWIQEAVDGPGSGVVIDEIGKLEAQGGGFAPILRKLLVKKVAKHLYLVVRKDLVTIISKYFCLQDTEVITVDKT